MPAIIEPNTPLPGFRPDLRLFAGPEEPDGSPTYNLQDPVKGKYFQFSWGEHLVYEKMRPGITLEELVNSINTTTTLRVDQDLVRDFLLDCFRHGLLATPVTSEHISALKEKQEISIFLWVLYNYLFMRFPLFNPDKFLARTLPYVRFLGSTPAFVVYAFFGIVGVMLLFIHFGEFVHNFSFFFNLEGFVDYFFAISIVKIIHEFSHAYTAKRYGIYVPSMGIALIVLWPVLYTDVTDGWKLPNRRHRIYISAAGLISETIIAGFCTVGWALTQPGLANSIFFVIASVTWVSTLVINLNPAIRFDGYYILSDLWGVDNLQPRTFAVTRWKFREIFLGLQAPCPEPRLSRKQLFGFMFYAVYTWIYRVFLYTAIALFVYHTFTKALGIFLFFIEVGIFIFWPISWEVQELIAMKDKLTFNPRLIATVSVVGILLGWAILPLPHTEMFPGVVAPLDQQIIYAPTDSVIRKIYVHRNEEVKQGQALVTLESPSLVHQISSLEVDKKTIEKQLDLLSDDDIQRPYIPAKEAEYSTVMEKLAGLKDLQEELNIKAKIAGKVILWNQYLRVGMALRKDFVLGKIADIHQVEVVFFVPEESLHLVSEGQAATFYIPSTHQEVRGKVVRINPVPPENLEYFTLASVYQGQVAVNPNAKTGKLELIDAYYTVHVELDKTDEPLPFEKTGDVVVRGPWRSKLMGLIHGIMRILWREGSL